MNHENFFPFLVNDRPELGLEGKPIVVFLFVDHHEISKYAGERTRRNLGGNVKIVSIPAKKGPAFAPTAILHFQRSCREALSGLCAFER